MSFLNSSPNHNKITVRHCRAGALLCCLAIFGAVPSLTEAQIRCRAESGPRQVALVELYTSEGCSSCPPADRWLGALPENGFDSSRVVPLAFHVDYWDYLGWNDRFAHSGFSARQRAAANRHGARFVYTPQVLINDQDVRLPWVAGDLNRRVSEITSRAARAKLSLDARAGNGVLKIRLGAAYDGPEKVDVYVALTQDNLETKVGGGENAGRTLKHRFVVRQLWGPMSVGGQTPLTKILSAALGADLNRADVAVSAFVQNRATGEVLQALSASVCGD